MKLLVSACLLGENCKYSGGNNYDPAVAALAACYELVPVCPEQLGGLPTPRAPSERVGARVLTRDGADVTDAFRLGAEKTLEIALEHGIQQAVFQARSPSCGCGAVYDGTFSGTLVPGDGVTTALLREHGIEVVSHPDELLCAPKASKIVFPATCASEKFLARSERRACWQTCEAQSAAKSLYQKSPQDFSDRTAKEPNP